YFSLKYKAVVLIFVSLLLGLSIYGITIIETSFMPEMESAQMSASLTMPPDSSTEDTYSIGDKVQERILEIDEVTSVGAMGNDPSMQMGFSAGDISFYILLRENRTMTNAEVAELILEKTADIEGEIDVSTSNMDMSVLVGNGIEVVVKGNSLDDLFRAADEVASILLSIEGVAEVSAGDDDRGRETRIEVDKNAAMREGLTVAQVFREIAGVLSGETRSTTIRAEQGDYPVIVAGPETESLTRENIRDYVFMVTKQDGTETEVLLSDVAIISDAYSPSSIRRDNQSRYISVTATLEEGYNIGLISRDIESRLAGYTPPQGMMFEIAGETEMIENAIDDIILMVLLAIILIYLIMVAQFQSLLSPFIILLTIPLAFTGGLLLLWVTGIELSLPAMLGFLILIGVVVNNGIVYIDYVNKLRAAGRQKRQALIETGMVRVRPILMTTLTTVLAMTPIALGLGSGSDATQPMAVVAIGGLTYATLLTLLVVPIMYDLLNRKPMRANQLET
ncbi:MAG TPA: efflux RND transporter permease subunit, partial [Candidatus Limnocylindrales bacterium]|nr:efflux RND transporter permease subunit [Candidatus Limnocylindrales bacterium]